MSHRGYEAVIGLEIHAQLKTKSKIFSTDSTTFEASDNENTTPVSLGMPGTLPVMNQKVIELAMKAGLALGCEIREYSVFERKNYFYPDLSKGYQISQYALPICEKGSVEFKLNGENRKINITRAHLEEDAGKSTHYGDYTLINYNRAGTPLLEIVSEPEIRSAAEAAEYARTIRQILRYVDACDGNLEEGSLRCDCNVSVRKIGATQFGTKVELKNINSFRFIEKAIEYEIERQIDQIELGQKIVQETRLYDPDKNRTISMRSKEDAQDYRYFPDPDLLPLVIDKSLIEGMRIQIPEMPFRRIQRYMKDYGLSELDAMAMTTEKETADYFETCGKLSGNYKSSANWIMTDLTRELNESGLSIVHAKISANHLAELIQMIDQGAISGKIAKSIFPDMWTSQKQAAQIIKEKGLMQITDTSVIEKIISEVIAQNAAQVADYRSGKTKILGFLIGAAMKATKGQASPELVNKLLLEKLNQ